MRGWSLACRPQRSRFIRSVPPQLAAQPLRYTAGSKAKAELMYPEATDLQSMRPPGSSDPARNSWGRRDSGFAVSPPAGAILETDFTSPAACRLRSPLRPDGSSRETFDAGSDLSRGAGDPPPGRPGMEPRWHPA